MTNARSKGGKARAAKLTAAERSAIGKQGAAARWNEDLPDAICGSPDRPLRIGDVSIQCFVLEDGTRVLSQGGFLEADPRRATGSAYRGMDLGAGNRSVEF